jgi:hypothetical protein
MAEPPDPTKTKRTYLVVSESRYRLWTAAAKREDRKLSNWLRLAADDAAASEESLPSPKTVSSAQRHPQELRIHFRVTAEQKARWKAAARREERPLGNWLKLAGDARAAMKVQDLLARAKRNRRKAAAAARKR